MPGSGLNVLCIGVYTYVVRNSLNTLNDLADASAEYCSILLDKGASN